MTDRAGSDIDPADSEQLFLPGFRFDLFFCYRFAGSKIRNASCDVVFASSVCQQAKVTNPHITFGQYVKQESSDKFISLERHGFFAVIVGIIPPEKRDMAIPVGKDAVVTDGDPVGISAEVLKDTFGAIEGRLAVDNPLLSVKLPPEGFKVVRFLEMTDTAGENNLTSFEAMLEVVKELASEQGRHDPDRNEKTLAA
jgi:hypothetical protein